MIHNYNYLFIAYCSHKSNWIYKQRENLKIQTLNANTTCHVKILKIWVYCTNRNIIMNCVGNDGEKKPWKSFSIFVYVWTAKGTTIDSSFIYLDVMSFIGEEIMETTWRVKNFVEKNLLIIYLLCRVKRLHCPQHRHLLKLTSEHKIKQIAAIWLTFQSSEVTSLLLGTSAPPFCIQCLRTSWPALPDPFSFIFHILAVESPELAIHKSTQQWP